MPVSAPQSALLAVRNAELRLQQAQEACPHWDFENDGIGHACCEELEDAERAHADALRRIEVNA